MKRFLSASFTVKQVLLLLLFLLPFLFGFYVFKVYSLIWERDMGHVGTVDSPYYKLVPKDCRQSAYRAVGGEKFISEITEEKFAKLFNPWLLTPPTNVFSLPDSEKKLGIGMQGIPCMGWSFIMALHATNFKRRDLFVDASGDVIASITYEVMKPYKKPLPENLLVRQDWSDVWTNPNDKSLVSPIVFKKSGAK